MDDLGLIREFRRAQRSLDESARAAARDRLLAHVAGEPVAPAEPEITYRRARACASSADLTPRTLPAEPLLGGTAHAQVGLPIESEVQVAPRMGHPELEVALDEPQQTLPVKYRDGATRWLAVRVYRCSAAQKQALSVAQLHLSMQYEWLLKQELRHQRMLRRQQWLVTPLVALALTVVLQLWHPFGPAHSSTQAYRPAAQPSLTVAPPAAQPTLTAQPTPELAWPPTAPQFARASPPARHRGAAGTRAGGVVVQDSAPSPSAEPPADGSSPEPQPPATPPGDAAP